MVGHGGVEFANEVGKEHVTAGVALVDGVDEETGGQSGLAAATDAQPDEVLMVVHIAQGVVEGHDLLLVELGLALERIGLDDQRLGEAGMLEPELAGVWRLRLYSSSRTWVSRRAWEKPLSAAGLRMPAVNKWHWA